MSSTDNRIVQMQFDNAQFEANVKNTMRSLEQLEDSLQLTGATRGMDRVASESKTLCKSMDSVGSAVETVKMQFSALQIAGVVAMSKLTLAAIDVGKKINNAIFGQIVSGGIKRSQNIENAKFQLEGLGVAWEKIYDDIDYGVNQTAYGLDEAARVASQLVASLDLSEAGYTDDMSDQMKRNLRAISGVAAMTNSSYAEIGDIFTTVASNGKLMTMQLRQLAARGLNASAKLARAFNVTEEEMNKMVTQGKISFTDFANAMDEAFGEHAKEANKTFSGAMSNVRAALSRIGQKFADPVFENLRKVLNSVRLVINDINAALKPVYEMVQGIIEAIAGNMIALMDQGDFVEGLQYLALALYSYVRPFIAAMQELGLFTLSDMPTMASNFLEFAKSIQLYGEKAEAVKNIIKGIINIFRLMWEVASGIFHAISPLIQEVARALGLMTGESSTLFGYINDNYDVLVAIIRIISEFIRLKIVGVIQKIHGTLRALAARGINVHGVLQNILNTVIYLIVNLAVLISNGVAFVSYLLNNLPSISDILGTIVMLAAGAATTIGSFFTDIFSSIFGGGASNTASFRVETEVGDTSQMSEAAAQSPEVQESLNEMADAAEETGKRTERAMKGASDATDEYAERMDRATEATERNAEAQAHLNDERERSERKKPEEKPKREENRISSEDTKTSGISREAFKESMFKRAIFDDDVNAINVFFDRILDFLNVNDEKIRNGFHIVGDTLSAGFGFIAATIGNIITWFKKLILGLSGNWLSLFSAIYDTIPIQMALVVLGVIKAIKLVFDLVMLLPNLGQAVANTAKGFMYSNLAKVIWAMAGFFIALSVSFGALVYFSKVADLEKIQGVIDIFKGFLSHLITLTWLVLAIATVMQTAQILGAMGSILKGASFYKNFSINLASFGHVLIGIGVILAVVLGAALWIAKDPDGAVEALELATKYLIKMFIAIGVFLTAMAVVSMIAKQLSMSWTVVGQLKGGFTTKGFISPMTQMAGLLVALVPVIFTMVFAIKALSGIPAADIWKGVGAISVMMLALSIIVTALNITNISSKLGSGENIKSMNAIAKTILSLALLMGVVAGVVYLMQYVSTEEIHKAGVIMVATMGFVVITFWLMALIESKLYSVSPSTSKIISYFASLAGIVLVVTGVVLLMQYVSMGEIGKAALVLGAIMLFVAGTAALFAVINMIPGGGNTIGSSIAFFAGLAIIIVALMGLVYVIGMVNWNNALQVMPYILDLVGLLVLFAGALMLLTIFQGAWKSVLTATFGIAAIIGMLAVLVYQIGQVNWEKAQSGMNSIIEFMKMLIGFMLVLALIVAIGALAPQADVAIALVMGIILALGFLAGMMAVVIWQVGEASLKFALALPMIYDGLKLLSQLEFDSISEALDSLGDILWKMCTMAALIVVASVLAGGLGSTFALLGMGIQMLSSIPQDLIDKGVAALDSLITGLNETLEKASWETILKGILIGAAISLMAISIASALVLLGLGIMFGALFLTAAGAILYYGGDLIRLGGEKLIEVLTALAPQFEENAEAMNSACGALITFGVELMGAGLMMTIGGALLLVGAAAVVVASAFLAYALGAMSEAVNGEEINNILDNIGNFMLLSTYVTMLGVALSVGSAFFIAGALLLLVGVKIFNSAIEELQEELFALDVIAEHMSEIGECIPMGLVEGLINKSDLFYQAMQDLGTNAINIFNDRMGIHSPSEEMRASGHWIMAGIVEGIEDKWPNLAQGLANLANLIPTTINNNLDMSSVSNNIANAGSTGGVGLVNNLSGVLEDGANDILIPGAWDTGNLMGQAMSQAMMEQFSGAMNSIAATFNHYSNGMDLDKIAGQNATAALEAWKGTQAAIDSGAIEEIPAAGLGTISLDQLDLSDFLNTKSSGSPGGSPVTTDDLDLGNIGGGGGGGGGSSGITTDDLVNSIASNSGAGTGINDISQGGTNINSNNTYNFTQNNYSPKELDRTELYEQTNYQLKRWYGWMQSNV